MGDIPISQGPPPPELEPGVYFVTCTDVEEQHFETPRFKGGENAIRFSMTIEGKLDAEGEPIVLFATANAHVGKKSKLTRWAAAMGWVIDFDDPTVTKFNPDVLKAAQCMATVVKGEEEDSWPRISDLTAVPVGFTGPAQNSAPTPQTVKALGPPMDISTFWQKVKGIGLEVSGVTTAVEKEYGLEPKDLTDQQRGDYALKVGAI